MKSARDPEPMAPRADAPEHEYLEWLRAHEAWTARKAKANPKAQPKAEEERIAAPEKTELHLAPVFPIDVFPAELRTWALAVAEFNQVPKTMACMFALQALGIAGIHLEVQIREGWREPTVLQSMLIASPSERKSPVFSSAMSPVYEWGRREKKRCAATKVRLMNELARELTTESGQAKPVVEGTPEAQRVAELKAQLAAVPEPRRRIADDVTPEEFMRLMAENEGTMCLVSDEADVFQSFGGRYSQGEPKLAPLLKGWDGKSPLIYDRVGSVKGRVNIMIERPRAGIAIAGQHTVLQTLKDKPVYAEKGMLARMLYVVLPERTSKRRLNPAGVAQGVHEDYAEAVARLFELEADRPLELANRVDYGQGWLVPKWLWALRERVEEGVLSDGEFAGYPSWAGKLVSNMARAAALLEAVGGGGEAQLAALGEFFIGHAKRTFSSGAQPARGTVEDEYVLTVRKLREKFPPRPGSADSAALASKVIGTRDIRRSWGRLQGIPPEQLDALIERLLLDGHLLEEASNDMGRKVSKRASRLLRVVHPVERQGEFGTHEDDMTDGSPVPRANAPDVEFFGDPDES